MRTARPKSRKTYDREVNGPCVAAGAYYCDVRVVPVAVAVSRPGLAPLSDLYSAPYALYYYIYMHCTGFTTERGKVFFCSDDGFYDVRATTAAVGRSSVRFGSAYIKLRSAYPSRCRCM